jgi:guanylate kinase
LNKKLNDSDIESLGNVIVVSAPSGAGKTSICSAVIDSYSDLVYSVSYTTRLPRKNEKNGKEYFFVSESVFKEMIEKDKFAEWAKVHDNYYGTSKILLDSILNTGKNILLDIDVQGGVNIKKQYSDACMIFVMTPDFKTLEKRLISRNKDPKEIIDMRLSNAKRELEYLQEYEYLVINKNLNNAVNAVKIIVKSLGYKIQKNRHYFTLMNRG